MKLFLSHQGGKLLRKLYEAIEIGNDILLVPSPLDKDRIARIERLTDLSIKEHRKTLENLSQ